MRDGLTSCLTSRRFALFFGLVVLLSCGAALVAQQNAVFVHPNGNVGIGTDTPAQELHVRTTAPQIVVESNAGTTAERILLHLANRGKVRFLLTNSDPGLTGSPVSWTFDNDGDFTISKIGTGVNEFRVDGSGNLFIRGTLSQNSSRSAKENLAAVDPNDVLQKLVSLPIHEWNYTSDPDNVRHVGPFSEDFYEAFGLNGTERAISVADTAGVAFAAIKALHTELEGKDRRIGNLERQVAELRSLVETLHR